MKRRFSMDEVINLCDNVYYVTADDVIDLCDLRDIGFENVRWVKDLFTEFGGCWVAEKEDFEAWEADCNDCKHGGMLVCLSVRVGKMLDEYCKNESKNEDVKIRNKVEDLMNRYAIHFAQSAKMYDLNVSLDKWNGDNKCGVDRIVLEDLISVFRKIRDRQTREIEL